MQRALPATLVIDKIRFIIPNHHVPRLKIAVQKIIAVGSKQKIDKRIKIVLERLFVKRNLSQLQKIILEIVQIPHHRLPVEGMTRVTYGIIHTFPAFHLETRQPVENFFIDFRYLLRNLIRITEAKQTTQ